MLRFMGSQRIRHDWTTKLNWTELKLISFHCWVVRSVESLPSFTLWRAFWLSQFGTVMKLPRTFTPMWTFMWIFIFSGTNAWGLNHWVVWAPGSATHSSDLLSHRLSGLASPCPHRIWWSSCRVSCSDRCAVLPHCGFYFSFPDANCGGDPVLCLPSASPPCWDVSSCLVSIF